MVKRTSRRRFGAFVYTVATWYAVPLAPVSRGELQGRRNPRGAMSLRDGRHLVARVLDGLLEPLVRDERPRVEGCALILK